MKKMMISCFTRTPLHVGCGSSVGVVDLPVLRERTTGFPVIPGSTFKGVLADLFLEQDGEQLKRSNDGTRLFGSETTENTKRGALLVGELRLAAFPVRSAKGGFVWATCPLILERLGIAFNGKVDEMFCYGAETMAFENTLILEEYSVERTGPVPEEVIDALKVRCDVALWQNTLQTRLVVLSDTLFAHFTKYACEIAHHNKIDDATEIVKDGALFSQENIPSEAFFTGEILSQNENDLALCQERIQKEKNLLQIGADATTGLGWCSVTMGIIE